MRKIEESTSVMATGSGKTRTVIALVRCFIESRMDKKYPFCRQEFTCYAGKKKFCKYAAKYVVYESC